MPKTKKSKLENDWSALVKYYKENPIPSARIINNYECIKDNKVEKEMVEVGCFAMCKKCFKEEFKTDDPVGKEPKQYKKWLEVYKEKYC